MKIRISENDPVSTRYGKEQQPTIKNSNIKMVYVQTLD